MRLLRRSFAVMLAMAVAMMLPMLALAAATSGSPPPAPVATDPAQTDFLADVLGFLAQYVLDNRHTIAGKLLGMLPGGLGVFGVAMAFVERAYGKELFGWLMGRRGSDGDK